MSPEAIRAMLADFDRGKKFVENLLTERNRQAEAAKRKRDSLLEQKERIMRDQAKAAQVLCVRCRP